MVSNMVVLTADLENRPPRKLRSHESISDPSEIDAADAPMPATDEAPSAEKALAKRLADAEAMLQHERAGAVHAEQVWEAQNNYLAGQDREPTPPHSSPARSPRSPRDDTPGSSKILNPLERIELEHDRLGKAHREGISAADC